jgi:hypothetical protein
MLQNPIDRISIEALGIEAAIETTPPAFSAALSGWERGRKVAAERLVSERA